MRNHTKEGIEFIDNQYDRTYSLTRRIIEYHG